MAALRSVRRLQQVLLLPRISVTSIRAQSGGKGSHTEISKTLVSFPVKISHFQQPATGENRSEPPRPVTAPLPDVESLGGVSDRESQLGQEVSHGQSVDGTSHKEDSSSSSSSDSSSDSDSDEDNGPVNVSQANKESNGGGHKGLADQKSDRLSPLAPEQKDEMGLRGENTENLQESAPEVTTEEQSPHPVTLSITMTRPGADKMKTPDRTVPTEDPSSTTAAGAKDVKILSTSVGLPAENEKSIPTPIQCNELPAETVETSGTEPSKTHIVLSTTSEDLSTREVEMSARKTHIVLSSTSEDLSTGEVEMSAPKPSKTHIVLSTTSEDLSTGEVEMSAPIPSKIQIVLSSTSEDLSTGEVEMLAAESIETQILSSMTSEELPTGDEAAELYESYSPQEPRAAPQEPFDNTRYQNLQHFTYTPFTFVDVDVEMAKYRLPQPSSGRPSPRH